MDPGPQKGLGSVLVNGITGLSGFGRTTNDMPELTFMFFTNARMLELPHMPYEWPV